MTKKTKAADQSVVTKEATAYIGRSILGLSQYTVFKGGVLPPHIVEMCEKLTAIRGLIVPVSQLQEARKNINKKGHILYFYARQLETQLKEKEA